MPTSITEPRALARTLKVDDDTLTVGLADGRTIVVPVVWFPRLASASAEARSTWELLGDGEGIHWPDVDEDLSVEGLLAGNRGP
jgi:hypothetical protein